MWLKLPVRSRRNSIKSRTSASQKPHRDASYRGAACSLLTIMTSVLSTTDSSGVEIQAITPDLALGESVWSRIEAQHDDLGKKFLKQLQSSSADLAAIELGPHVRSGFEWDGCVYAAMLMVDKVTEIDAPAGPALSTNEDEDVSSIRFIPPKSALDTFGAKYEAPSSLSQFYTPRAAYTKRELADMERNLRAHLAISDNAGRLIKYGVVHYYRHQSYNREERAHAFLFEDRLIIIQDAPNLRPWAGFVDPPVLVESIALSDVSKITPELIAMTVTDPTTHALMIECMLPDGLSRTLTLSIPRLAGAVAWITSLELQAATAGLDIENDLINNRVFPAFIVAMNTWDWKRFSDMRNVSDLGPLLCHSVVENISPARSSFMACLFENYLFFVTRDGNQQPILASRHVVMDKIVHLYDRSYEYRWGSSNVISVVTVDDESRSEDVTHLDFTFEVVGHKFMWQQALERWSNGHKFVDISYKEPSTLDAITEALPPPPSPMKAPEKIKTTTRHYGGVVLLFTSAGGNVDEYNICVGISDNFQSQGLGTIGIAHGLEMAFETLHAHRVQARILHHSSWNEQPHSAEQSFTRAARAVGKFIHLGFTHEGVRRRVMMHPTNGIWADVTVLAMLDSDWLVRNYRKPPPKMSVWDEMFTRHKREHEALLTMEERGLKRTRSTETVRDLRSMADAAPTPSHLTERDDLSTAPPPSTAASDMGSLSSWDAVTETSSVQSLNSKIDKWSVSQSASADDAADEYAEWDMDEDDEDEDVEDDSD